MNYILFDDYSRTDLLPFTYTKPVCEIRIGILTIKEKWEHYLKQSISYQTQEYLSHKYKSVLADDTLYINAKICPNADLLNTISKLEINSGVKSRKDLIAFRTSEKHLEISHALSLSKEIEGNFISVKNVWDIFKKNGEALIEDFKLITQGKKSQPLSPTNTLLGDANQLFIEEGAIIEASILNTKSGPIYIAKDAEVMEGSVVRGPFSLGEHSTLKLATKIYGPTTIGPHCKVGGEINNSVVFGYSNKAHDGFLGNSVIGEWCNLGADTNTSNLKNNYANVKLFNYTERKMMDTGLQFCGLMMGDYSKCGINTMFNTGTMVGVGANIYGSNFPPTYIAPFSWGGSDEIIIHQFEKMIETTRLVYARRELELKQEEIDILKTVFNATHLHAKS